MGTIDRQTTMHAVNGQSDCASSQQGGKSSTDHQLLAWHKPCCTRVMALLLLAPYSLCSHPVHSCCVLVITLDALTTLLYVSTATLDLLTPKVAKCKRSTAGWH